MENNKTKKHGLIEFMLTTPGYEYHSGYHYCGKCKKHYSEKVEVCPYCGRETKFVMVLQ